jgi:hypothetical protein
VTRLATDRSRDRAAVFSIRFSSVGQAMNAANDEYDFEKPATRMTWSYDSPK